MNNQLKNYFNGKKVLITGNTGFKGSWLTLWLKNLGAEITGYSEDVPSKPSIFSVLGLKDEINHITGDIRDYNSLKNTIEYNEPEIVFHMAAQALVRKSYLEPLKTYETNVMGTVNLLEAVRATESIKTIINITSDKCYENKEWNYGYRENDPMGGHDPYSSSKGCSELVTAAYRDSFFNKDNYSTHKVSLASVRAGNVIGGGDWAEDRLLPDCIMSLVENKEIIIRSPRSLRPWQHVLDALNGYLKLAIHMMKQGDKFNEAWNFGPTEGNIISVEELVNKIIDFWGSGTYAIKKTDNLHEATLLKLDINKAMFLLNWKPVLSIDESLQSTIDWYKSYYSNNMDMMEFTINQINLYQKKS